MGRKIVNTVANTVVDSNGLERIVGKNFVSVRCLV